MSETSSNSSVHPWHMLAGLGSIDRSELCSFLANFRDASLLKLAVDRFQDLTPFTSQQTDTAKSAYQRRLEATATALDASGIGTAALRLMLWAELCKGLGCSPPVPLSFRSASVGTAELAAAVADRLAGTVEREIAPAQDWRDQVRQASDVAQRAFGLGDRPQFSAVVAAQAGRLIAQALQKGELDEEQRALVTKQFKARVSELSPEVRTEAESQAVKQGDAAIISLLAGSGALAGIGVAVELAGFGAYILAAQASAFLPLIGGKAAVSALFVLANPLFAVPAILGGGWFAKRKLEQGVRGRLAAGLAVMLALRGLSGDREALGAVMSDFRSLDVPWPDTSSATLQSRIQAIRAEFGSSLPELAGLPPGELAKGATGIERSNLEGLLFPYHGGSAAEVGAVGALTLGEVIYSAASIDPQVVVAADFARTADIGDVFRFGAFAEDVGDLAGHALTGAENNLRGYIAEQIVAARLLEKGHIVSTPEAANNPGFDLLVDDQHFQVKCLLDIDGLAEHFERYPDISVYANRDLAEEVASSGALWAGKVHFVDGFDYRTVDTLLDRSLDGGAEVMDLDVPIFAVAVSAARHLHGWWKGSIELTDLPFEIALDGAIRGSLSVAGGLSGKALGLVLFGPAGAVVFGGVGGVLALFGTGTVRGKLTQMFGQEWISRLDQVSVAFISAAEEALLRKLRLLDAKLDALSASEQEEVRWVHQRMLDDRVFIAEGLVQIRELSSIRDAEERTRAAIRAMHDWAVHPAAVHGELQRLVETAEARPGLSEIALPIWSRFVHSTSVRR